MCNNSGKRHQRGLMEYIRQDIQCCVPNGVSINSIELQKVIIHRARRSLISITNVNLPPNHYVYYIHQNDVQEVSSVTSLSKC